MFGKKPEEDLVLYVSEFLWRHLQPGSGGAQIEVCVFSHFLHQLECSHIRIFKIEGKLGLILNKHTRERIRLPIATESVLINDGSYRFDSNMSMAQHAHFNRLLNGLMQPGCKTRYVHTKEIDQYYQSGGGNKTRVSRDQKTGQVREVIMKKRIADIEIHLPNSPLDCRISVNWEIPIPQPPKDATTLFRRHKDRLSYSHEAFRVDLTQVRQFDDRDVEKQLTHELEVEFIRIGDLLAEKEKRQAGKMNGFTENVDVFLNNLRYLSRKSVITH
ncbi:CYTH-like domain-containing protein [Phlyctochytrium arcticum]|nr:CYTH-like domain-containing protein [Phlyctochytrium arcticum]